MRAASALVTPVTLEVLDMKLDPVPVPLMNVARGPLLLLAWLPTAASVLAAVLLPPSLQLPGSMLPSGAASWAACGNCGSTDELPTQTGRQSTPQNV